MWNYHETVLVQLVAWNFSYFAGGTVSTDLYPLGALWSDARALFTRVPRLSWKRSKPQKLQALDGLLGGGFKYFFIFIPIWGRTHFDEHIFQRGCFNHQPVYFECNFSGKPWISIVGFPWHFSCFMKDSDSQSVYLILYSAVKFYPKLTFQHL